MKILFYFFALTYSLFTFAEGDIAAVVDDDVITKYALDKRYETVIQGSNDLTQAEQNKMKGKLLNVMIDELILKQEAKRLKIKVSDNELNYAIAQVAKNNNLSEEQFFEQLKQEGADLQEVKEQIKNQVILSKMLEQISFPKVKVADKEISEFFDQFHPKQAIIGYYVFASSKDKEEMLAKIYNDISDCKKLAKNRKKYQLQDIEIQEFSANRGSIDQRIEKLLSDSPNNKTKIFQEHGNMKFILLCGKKYPKTSDTSNAEQSIQDKKAKIHFNQYIKNLRKRKFIEKQL